MKIYLKKKRKLSNNVDTDAVSHDILVNKYNILSIPCILSKMIEEEQRCEAYIESKICLEYIIDQVEIDINEIYLYDIFIKQNELILNFGCFFPLNYMENEYYSKKIIVNERELMELFNKTKDQSENSLWHEIRNYRISASVKAHKIKSCRNLSVEHQNNLAISLLNENVLGYQGKINVAYGKKYEEEAIESYSKLFGATILKCGIVIHAQKPWLCASPDGIVTEKNQTLKVLEIKCPISCRSKLIVDHENRICNVSYLKFENNKIVLKPSHQYFTQCQILMYCTGLE